MDIFAIIAERKIREAMDRGEFDNLRLKGQPLPVENLANIPEDLRMGYRILRNAGILPEELQLRREILSLRDLLRNCTDPEETAELTKWLTETTLHYNILMERNARNIAFHNYEGRIRAKLGP